MKMGRLQTLAWGVRWTALCAISIAACGCAASSSATVHVPVFRSDQQPWTFMGREGLHVTTDHFDFHTTLEDAELRDYLPEFLETTYQFYESILPASAEMSEERPRLQTYLFASRHEWDAFSKRRFPERYPLYRKITAGGYSEGDTCVAYNIGRAQTLSVIAHEGWHQYLAGVTSESVPAWLNEGLATYCESVEFRKGRPYFVPQRNTFRINHLCNALSRGETSRLGALLGTDAGQVIDGEQSSATTAYYAQAWALMVYLRHGEQGRYESALVQLLNDIKDGTFRAPSRSARITSPSPSETSVGESVFRAYITDEFEAFETAFNEFAYHLCWKR